MELLAAIVGVADVTARASTGLWKLCEQWRDAPKDIHLLRDDLVQANAFFAQIQKGLTAEQARGGSASRWPPECIRELERLLQDGQALVLGVEKMVDELMSPGIAASGPSHQSLSGRRKLLWVTKLRWTSEQRRSLKTLMGKICVSLVSLNVTVTTDLQAMLKSVDENILQAVDKVSHKSRDHFDTKLEASRIQVVDQVVTQLVDHLTSLQVTTPRDLDRSLEDARSQLRDDITHHINSSQSESLARLDSGLASSIVDIVSHMDRRITELRSDIASSSEEGQLAIQTLRTTLIENRSKGSSQPPRGTSMPSSLGNTDPWAALLYQSAARARFANPGCESGCICQCHSISAYANWKLNWFETVLGSIQMTYRGFLSKTRACSSPTCQTRHQPAWIRLDYRLPSWLLRIVFTLAVSLTFTAPEMLLRVVRHIPSDNSSRAQSIFGFVARRDLDGLKWALQTRKVGVHDVTGSNRSGGTYTALAWAIITKDVPMAKLLLDAGSDVIVGSDYVSPAHHALSLFSEGVPEGKRILEMLPIDEFLTASEFSDLHKIVLGFLPLNLRESLQRPHLLAQVNKRTMNGWTPLHWAARRGDATDIETLIEAGAEVDSQSSAGVTPLLNACSTANLAAVRALLDRGAAIGHRDKRLATCLHFAAQSKVENVSLLSFLISRGAKVNAQNVEKAVPLACAVMANRPKLVSLLLQNGADATNRDWDGDIELFEAIAMLSHKSAQLLLDYGADYTNINNRGAGILHILATAGDLRMIRLFTEARMRGLDPTVRDLDGKTAMDLFEERWDHTPELQMQFKDLLRSLGDGTTAAEVKGTEIDTDGESSDGDFYDALETWQGQYGG
ncbi:hypothetical protein CDV31_011579 [Fusarium ambrosium]|uniref:Uncharacterized protein n=1 Tax=Fusarium ambrosium TaxID=131363 RepID=A0A428TG01_9HYPO|nr:hypothetical protein CDV31_011579 [Fusarium ambrosium]